MNHAEEKREQEILQERIRGNIRTIYFAEKNAAIPVLSGRKKDENHPNPIVAFVHGGSTVFTAADWVDVPALLEELKVPYISKTSPSELDDSVKSRGYPVSTTALDEALIRRKNGIESKDAGRSL